MSRPSANLDKKMLEAGVDIIINEGIEGLTARNICKYANVNLGMFNYYFKSKEYYISILYSGLHKQIEEYMNIASVSDKSSLVKLKHALLRLNQFAHEHQKLSTALFSDAFLQTKVYTEYLENGIIPQFDILINLIISAKEDGYLRSDLAVMDIFGLLFFGCIVPEIFSSRLGPVQKYLHLKKDKYESSGFSKRMELVFNELESIDIDRVLYKLPSGF